MSVSHFGIIVCKRNKAKAKAYKNIMPSGGEEKGAISGCLTTFGISEKDLVDRESLRVLVVGDGDLSYSAA